MQGRLRDAKKRVFAVANLEGRVQETDRAPDGRTRGVGSEVKRAVFLNFASEVETWKTIRHADADVRIRLIVFKTNIVPRPMFFDQRRFDEKRFDLGAGQNIIDFVNVADEKARFRRVIF